MTLLPLHGVHQLVMFVLLVIILCYYIVLYHYDVITCVHHVMTVEL